MVSNLPFQIFARKSSGGTFDTSIYGMSMQRDWLYSSNSISIKYEGCVWGYVEDREDMSCMDDESGDGTTMWYMMANCRRAQVAYSVYASTGTTSCGSGDFKETLITKSGLAEFAYTLGYYGYNSPISGNDVNYLPMCEGDGSGYYLSVGCSASGSFTIDRFSDAYCLQYYDTYDNLSNINSAMKSLSKCYSCYSSKYDESPYGSLCAYLIPNSGSCSKADSEVCTTNSFVKNAGSTSAGSYKSSSAFSNTGGGNLSFTNKLKYGLGSALLVGSVILFIAILFTNRRKRRALLHRRFRQGDSNKSGIGRSSSKRSSSSKNKVGRSPSSSSRKSSKSGVFA
jgi:hypothetical protein